MTTLYQFHRPHFFVFPNMSPFCVKVETFLRVMEQPYQIQWTANLSRMPRKKLPVVRVDEEAIPDSHHIIEKLRKRWPEAFSEYFCDDQLSSEQKAVGLATQRLVEDHLIPCLIYFRWVDVVYWPKFKSILFGKMNWPARDIIAGVVHRRMKKTLWMSGLGRHTREELLDFVAQDFAALAELFGNKKYLFGEKISTYELSLFGAFGNALTPVTEEVYQLAKRHPQLIEFVNRMMESYFPDVLMEAKEWKN